MIDYHKPDDDPVVAEIRRIREELAAEFDFDLTKAFGEIQRRQSVSARKYVTLPPRRTAPALANKVG